MNMEQISVTAFQLVKKHSAQEKQTPSPAVSPGLAGAGDTMKSQPVGQFLSSI